MNKNDRMQLARAKEAREWMRARDSAGITDHETHMRRKQEIAAGHIWTDDGRRCGLLRCQPDCTANGRNGRKG